MTPEQDVLENGRPKRRTLGVLLLGMVPLAVAGTAGFAASELVPEPERTSVALTEPALVIEPAATDIAPVIAPGSATEVDLAAEISPITVTLPPPPEPEPEPVVAKRSTAGAAKATTAPATKKAGSSAKKSTTAKSGGSKSSSSSGSKQSAQSYCSAPSSPYGAGGSVKGLLTAANKERARIGAGAMSWSGSLASAATSWSKAMASKDGAGNGSALAHNPNRPGAENVAVSSSSGGVGVGTAVNRAHTNWMYSNGHCRNIMNPAYSQMGAGAAATGNGNAVYTTANFR
ncbi:CAP domain-containing protein [Demequina sp. NBRC 110056]|uniref:CAP domain-containing protein n=1 Tax=Demequina sp. NBRC 110056 TaxID=1570345 RepID=UPI0009FDA531|nr:CAP domain-containing protein [Demequina sp. NBRC 110056]